MLRTLFLFWLLATAGCWALDCRVTETGAKGDGVTDDSEAIRAAVKKVSAAGRGALIFPSGSYLFKGRGNAIEFSGISNLEIRFESGAELLMDNLREDGRGDGHGIYLTGPASNIAIRNALIRWAKKPQHRSLGDGIRFDGYPADDKTIAQIRLIDCRVVDAPQTGAILHGCSDIFVQNFRPENTLADGLHFNACRRANISGVTGYNNGDDTLAFVTYYSPDQIGAYGNNKAPFAQPSLGDWSNNGSVATNIISRKGHACGMRISGGYNITVSNLNVSGSTYGIQLDAAQKTTDSRAVGWTYQASRNISIQNVVATGCDFGVYVRTLNYLPDADPAMWLPGIRLSNLSTFGCRKAGVQLRDTGGISLSGLRSDCLVSLVNVRTALCLSDVEINGANLEFKSTQGATVTGWDQSRHPTPFQAKEDLSDLVARSVSLLNIRIDRGNLVLSNCAGVVAEAIRISRYNCPAVTLNKAADTILRHVVCEAPVESNMTLKATQVRNIKLTDWTVPGNIDTAIVVENNNLPQTGIERNAISSFSSLAPAR